jgi:DNA processing protein
MNIQSALASIDVTQSASTRSTTSIPGWGTVQTEGNVSLLSRSSIAVVGSRRATHEGRALATAIASELVQRDSVTLSGLAAGIDKTAHETAMREGGRTVAVIGTSLDQAYPRHHASLQERIAIEHLVVSPFASGTPMARWHFPKRNRLMARLARGMILIEAGATSGTRHQVEECLSLGKPVLIHGSLLHKEIEWLNAAYARGGVTEWRDPREALEKLSRAGVKA